MREGFFTIIWMSGLFALWPHLPGLHIAGAIWSAGSIETTWVSIARHLLEMCATVWRSFNVSVGIQWLTVDLNLDPAQIFDALSNVKLEGDFLRQLALDLSVFCIVVDACILFLVGPMLKALQYGVVSFCIKVGKQNP